MYLWIRGALPLATLGSVLTITLLLLTPAGLSAEKMPDADTIIAPFRDAVYSHSLPEEEVRTLHGELLRQIETELGSLVEVYRARALAHYYLGRWYQAIKTRPVMVEYAITLRKERYLALRHYYVERSDAMEAYREARTEAKIYLESNPTAEAHRLYGEILGQMLFLGDAGEVISIGKKARRNVKKALKIDPTLTKAMIQEASRMAYTPLSYGGDPDGAREMYREILRAGVEDAEDLFNIYGGFGMAAFMEERDDEALNWFDEALTVYPGNVFAAGMADFIRGNLE